MDGVFLKPTFTMNEVSKFQLKGPMIGIRDKIKTYLCVWNDISAYAHFSAPFFKVGRAPTCYR